MSGQDERDTVRDRGVGLMERKEDKVERPKKYRVLILNDDYTPIEFVVNLVAKVFRRTHEEAATITLEVHNKGSSVAGVYTYEIAETKVVASMGYAAEHGHPLQITMEPES